jgi:hypothetical protein
MIGDYRVIGWAEYSRREGEYPGGYVVGMRGPGGDGPPYVLWEVHTPDGGQTWCASDGYYSEESAASAWLVFTEHVAKQMRRRRLAT